MAGPVTHIVLALLVLPLLSPDINIAEFIIGTSFPDIRYMGGLSRKETHVEPISWQQIVDEPSAFRAGMLFHNLVDNLRIIYLESREHDISKLPEYGPVYTKLFPNMLKTAEDGYLYHRCTNWQKICDYFDTIVQEELDFGVAATTVRTWHSMIQEYIAQETDASVVARLCAYSHNDIYAHKDQFDPDCYFNELRSSLAFQAAVEDFYLNFVSYLVQFPTRQYTVQEALDTSVQMHHALTAIA
jgi:hypothetical protein